mmetsp:Transcript_36845/g.63597  ORF Transcript_36845/g.63597 Transcript_36845/m.63597 type:complete len:203 (-) Transcript_36845:108-716(-)
MLKLLVTRPARGNIPMVPVSEFFSWLSWAEARVFCSSEKASISAASMKPDPSASISLNFLIHGPRSLSRSNTPNCSITASKKVSSGTPCPVSSSFILARLFFRFANSAASFRRSKSWFSVWKLLNAKVSRIVERIIYAPISLVVTALVIGMSPKPTVVAVCTAKYKPRTKVQSSTNANRPAAPKRLARMPKKLIISRRWCRL